MKLISYKRKHDTKNPASETQQIDDFIRNFLLRHHLKESLEAFNQEWYEIAQKKQIKIDEIDPIPEIYVDNQRLEENIDILQKDLENTRKAAESARSTWDKLKKEREYHKMHHHRVQQEKHKLNEDIDKMKNKHSDYEQKYQQLTTKYETAMKEKMIIKMECERLKARTDNIGKGINNMKNKLRDNGKIPIDEQELQKKEEAKKTTTKGAGIVQGTQSAGVTGTKKKSIKLTPIPTTEPSNPNLDANHDPFPTKNINLQKSYKGHMMSVGALAVHPRKPFLATGSDDLTWKIWGLANGELIMSGEGHKDWISCIEFNPNGTHLATASGDSSIKVWDFINVGCAATFKDHIHPVWSISYHYTGDFIISGSMDHSSKLLDIKCERSRATFRGHFDSVNSVKFLPYSNTFASGSADKTVALWDVRSGQCLQTFYGHNNAVNAIDVDAQGKSVYSCDSDGVVKVWDIRTSRLRSQIDLVQYSTNSIVVDRSGESIAVACEDGLVRMVSDNIDSGELKFESALKGHTDVVLAVAFENSTRTLISSGADTEYKLWS